MKKKNFTQSRSALGKKNNFSIFFIIAIFLSFSFAIINTTKNVAALTCGSNAVLDSSGTYCSCSPSSYTGDPYTGCTATNTTATTATCDSGFTATAGVCFPDNTGLSSASIQTILTNVGSWLMGIFAILAIIAFVISGIQYLTSTGDTEQIEKAKNSAMYALIGVIIGLSGFVIIQAISRALDGTGYLF